VLLLVFLLLFFAIYPIRKQVAKMPDCKFKYIFQRAVVGMFEPTLVRIRLLQIFLFFDSALIFAALSSFLATPKEISNSDITIGKLIYYKKHWYIKTSYNYCDLVLELSNGNEKTLKSTTCNTDMFGASIHNEEVIIYHTQNLIKFDKIIIHQMKTKDGKIIIKFNENFKKIDKNVFLMSTFLFILALILIYALNTEKARKKYKYWKDWEERNKKQHNRIIK